MVLNWLANFQLSCFYRSVSSTPCLQSHTLRTLMVRDWMLGVRGLSWHHGSQLNVILKFCANCQLSSINKHTPRTTSPQSLTWRIWVSPDWILGGWGHSWHHRSPLYMIVEFFDGFHLANNNIRASRTHCPQSHTWRVLIVPDWRSVGMGCSNLADIWSFEK